jgi:hypothetical protein
MEQQLQQCQQALEKSQKEMAKLGQRKEATES